MGDPRRDPAVVWFRDDLGVTDHPALHAAATSGAPLVLLYVFDDTGSAARRPGDASRWWLHHSLTALAASIEKRGGRLTVRTGDAAEVVPDVLREAGATDLYLDRRYAPGEHAQDDRIAEAAARQGVAV